MQAVTTIGWTRAVSLIEVHFGPLAGSKPDCRISHRRGAVSG
jgi:hypothetical protein